MKRREILQAAAATFCGLSTFPLGWVAAAETTKRPKVLYFTRSAGFEHSVVHRQGDALSHSERILTEMGKKAGFDVECSQDGRIFDGDLAQYAAIAFFTSGDLISPQGNGIPMTPAGKQKLLDAVAGGTGFIGLHACTDSFHSKGNTIDPYIAMLGGEFVVHGPQQEAPLKITSQFPGVDKLGKGPTASFTDEWYAQKNYAKDLHVVLVQLTEHMQGDCYHRPDFPSTWARRQGKGRVFYTSLGHREDIWTNPRFQGLLLGGFAWAMGNVPYDVTPNIEQVTPRANELPKQK